jgi:HD-GYP domain-containing protein (c-di-GMP phosphodiesterase class II)
MLRKIAVSQVVTGMYVHALGEAWLHHGLWRTRFLVKDDTVLRKLRSAGVAECWIDLERGLDLEDVRAPASERVVSAPATAGAVPENPDPPESPVLVPMAEEMGRAAELLGQAGQVVRAMFETVRHGAALDPAACREIVDEMVRSIDRNRDALVSLARLKSAEEYLYLHSVAVCAHMIALGRQLGFGAERLRDAGLAGLLHDLGMATIAQHILDKPGALTADEVALIRQHPVRGHQVLVAAGSLGEEVLQVCRHHHERIDGRGYPDGLAHERLALLVRMATVCDVYDAITSPRAYRSGWDPAEATSRMASWRGQFDSWVFQAFVKGLGVYPIGSLVRMQSGKLGVVVEQNRQKLIAPTVTLFYDARLGTPIEPQCVDLTASDAGERIEGRESPAAWHFQNLDALWAQAHAATHPARRVR